MLRRLTALALMTSALFAGTAQAQPLPAWWIKQAMCIHQHESVDWHRRTDWRGYASYDHGGMQIDTRTWIAYASGDPADASPAYQLQVAYKIWRANGHRWGGNQWPISSSRCGLQ